jgi:alkyl hydroperoxide reductase subunit AhpF
MMVLNYGSIIMIMTQNGQTCIYVMQLLNQMAILNAALKHLNVL